jgi:hypothetical protein
MRPWSPVKRLQVEPKGEGFIKTSVNYRGRVNTILGPGDKIRPNSEKPDSLLISSWNTV